MKIKTVLIAVMVMVVIPWITCRVAEDWILENVKEETNSGKIIGEPAEKQREKAKVYQIPVLFGDGQTVAMPLEEYMLGVLLGEMPADFHPEALKAQAVVARTYTMKRNTQSQKHPGGAVCTDAACCQAYKDPAAISSEQLDKIQKAVNDTQGQVLTYKGTLIDATYFSCSGGRTEAAVAVWGTDVPYLQAVDSPGEENASVFTDTVTYSTDEFSRLLSVELHGPPDSWITDLTYTPGGGVDTIKICGTEFTGTELRSLLNLRSTAFRITALPDTITITTRGYGHRVGMSQYGAEAMAQAGSDYQSILAHYYPDTTLENRME